MLRPKIYIAGPEVFLPNALQRAEEQRELCVKYGFIPLHPMDNALDLGNKDYATAVRIYRGDVSQVRECDIIAANCNPFRGVCMDDGTAHELGMADALFKVLYGYISKLESLVERTIRDYPTTLLDAVTGLHVDREGYAVTDAFSTSINLMMQCGMTESGGRLVEGNFEACLRAIREDLDVGRLEL